MGFLMVLAGRPPLAVGFFDGFSVATCACFWFPCVFDAIKNRFSVFHPGIRQFTDPELLEPDLADFRSGFDAIVRAQGSPQPSEVSGISADDSEDDPFQEVGSTPGQGTRTPKQDISSESN